MVDQVEQRIDSSTAGFRVAFGQHVGAQQGRRAHRRHVERFADTGGVAADEVELQRAKLVAAIGRQRATRSPC
jgi:hypothetical protein